MRAKILAMICPYKPAHINNPIPKPIGAQVAIGDLAI